jgi:hypothetical protein
LKFQLRAKIIQKYCFHYLYLFGIYITVINLRYVAGPYFIYK